MNELITQSGPIILEPREPAPYSTWFIAKLLADGPISHSDIWRVETERPIFFEVPRTRDRFDCLERCALMETGFLHSQARKFAIVAKWHRWRGRLKIAEVWARRAENAQTAARAKGRKK